MGKRQEKVSMSFRKTAYGNQSKIIVILKKLFAGKAYFSKKRNWKQDISTSSTLDQTFST